MHGGNFRKNGPKIFTLMDYVALSSLNMNKQDYLFAVADVYLETLVKEWQVRATWLLTRQG